MVADNEMLEPKPLRLKKDGTPWAPPVRRPENTFIRWAVGMMRDLYDIPEEHIKVRQSPFGKTRTIYVLVNGEERSVRNKKELQNAVRELGQLGQ